MANSNDVALTTIDNPYSPFSRFDSWLNYDTEKGWNCCGYIDRVLSLNKIETSYLNEEEEDKKINEAIDSIVLNDPTGMYVKVEKLNSIENGKDYRVLKVS